MMDGCTSIIKSNNGSESLGKIKRLVVYIYLLSFVAQQFSIDYVSPIRPYMIFGIIALIISIVFFHALNTRNLNYLDYGILFFYGILLLFVFHAGNISDASRLFFGILILSCTYLIFRWWLSSMPRIEFESVFYAFSITFIRISFAWYIFGLYLINSLDYFVDPLIPHNLVAGVYLEGGLIPRFRGVTDSPNNYAMYFLLVWIWLRDRNYKINIYDKIIMFISVILTFSVTLFLILSLYYLFKIPGKIRYLTKLILGVLIILLALKFTVNYEMDDNFKELFFDRVERLSGGSGRLDLFESSLSIIMEKPFFGYGLNSARYLLQDVRDVKSTHNNILELGMEGGGGAIISYLMLLFVQIVAGVRIRVVSNKNFVLYASLAYALFGMSNVNIYADSYILLLAVSSFYLSLTFPRHYLIKKHHAN